MATRKQRVQFDCVSDLKARHTVQAFMKGYITRKHNNNNSSLLVRTQSFIQCKNCNINQTTNNLNCDKCGLKLSLQNRSLLRFWNHNSN